jgi:hypothetical protein
VWGADLSTEKWSSLREGVSRSTVDLIMHGLASGIGDYQQLHNTRRHSAPGVRTQPVSLSRGRATYTISPPLSERVLYSVKASS